MTLRLHKKIIKLAKGYPTLSEDKVERRLKRLYRMRDFYKDKMELAPEKQKLLFSGFVSSLVYTIHIVYMYHQLTQKLTKLAEELEDENRTDSEG